MISKYLTLSATVVVLIAAVETMGGAVTQLRGEYIVATPTFNVVFSMTSKYLTLCATVVVLIAAFDTMGGAVTQLRGEYTVATPTFKVVFSMRNKIEIFYFVRNRRRFHRCRLDNGRCRQTV